MNRLKIAVFLFLLITQSAVAQKVDYKDIFASIKTSRDFEVYQTLLDYQKEEPYFANTYYQLGIICQKWMRQYDPFLQSNDVREYIKNAKLYFSLCQLYFDEKDAQRNREFYQGAANKEGKDYPDYMSISKDIKDRISDVEIFKEYHSKSISALINCVTSYNLCIGVFNEINHENSRLKDLYFIANESFKSRLSQLKSDFDSSLYYFNILKASLKDYPLGNYNPTYTLSPVLEYRLHGLTSSDFLSPEVVLWDFGSWVTSFNQILSTEIEELNKKAFETSKTHSDYIKRLIVKNPIGIPSDYKVNPAFINKIYKYDFKSALARLFEYQEMKINFLEIYSDSPEIFNDSLNLRIKPIRSDYYFQLTNIKKQTDTSLSLLKSDATPEAINKYSEFFTSQFNGYNGLLKYIENQSIENNSILDYSFSDYTNIVLSEYRSDSIPLYIKYNNIPVNLNIIEPDQISGEGYFTFFKTEIPDKQVLISGSLVNSKSGIAAFVGLIDSLNTFKWIKTYKPGKADYYGLICKPVNDGFVLALQAKSQNSQSVVLMTLDFSGDVKTNREINTASIPRILLCDDVNLTTLLACKGAEYNSFSASYDSLGVYLFDEGMTILWENYKWFDGYLSNIIKSNNRFYIFGSFNKLNKPDNTLLSLENGVSNAFLNILDSDGSSLQFISFPNSFSYYPLKINKINSDFIDILSLKGINPSEASAYDKEDLKPHYLILDTQGKITFFH